jgi:hypothetical protein
MARWQQEKEAIQRQRKLKEELEQLRRRSSAPAAGDYGKASSCSTAAARARAQIARTKTARASCQQGRAC